MTELDNKLHAKFFSDPDWVLVEKMITAYLEPLQHINSIDTNRSNDEIATELKANQIVSERLNKFLTDCRIIGKISKNSDNQGFK